MLHRSFHDILLESKRITLNFIIHIYSDRLSCFLIQEFVTLQRRISNLKIDDAIRNGIFHGLNHMARNQHRKVFRAMQLLVLIKILCCSFFLCSPRHSDMMSINKDHVPWL